MNSSAHALRTVGTGLRALLVFTLITGIIYPLAMTGFGQLVPHRANGSIIYDADGNAVGSELIGQDFSADDSLFQSRPSAAGDNGYDAQSSGASNLGPTSEELAASIAERKEEIAAREGVDPSEVPADALTASGSGLDPHISPAYAEIQVARVAEKNSLSEDEVHSLVQDNTAHPALGFIGTERVNVLKLNLALKEIHGS